MKQFLILSFFLFLLIPMSAVGSPVDPGWYVSGGIGASKPDKGFLKTKKQDSQVNVVGTAYKMSPVLNAKVGYRANRFIRFDLNAQYRLIKMVGTDSTLTNYKPLKTKNGTVMVNLYLDANNYSIITPYITAGAGFSTINISDKRSTPAFNKTNMTQRAINIGGGIQVQLDENFGIDFVYKWTDLGILKLNPVQNTITSPGSPSNPINVPARKVNLGVREIFLNFILFM